MSMLLGESLRVLPPTAVTHTAATGTSTAATAIGGTGYYIFAVTKSAGDGVFVLWGTSTVAAASSSNGFPMSPGDKISFLVDGLTRTHFTVIRNGSTSEDFCHCKTGD